MIETPYPQCILAFSLRLAQTEDGRGRDEIFDDDVDDEKQDRRVKSEIASINY